MMLVDVLVKPRRVQQQVRVVGTSLQPDKHPHDGEQEVRVAILVRTEVDRAVVAIHNPAAQKT